MQSSPLARGRPLARLGLAGAVLATASLFGVSAAALSAEEARSSANKTIASVELQVGSVRRVAAEVRRQRPSRLVTMAELHLRTKDYEPAIHELNKVLELERQGKVPPAVAADAAFLLAEAYFASGQLHSAGRYYELVTDRADRKAYAPFAGRAASRLVDVALRTRRTDHLEDVLARVNRLAPSDPTGSLQYARAKTLFAQGDLAGARTAAAMVPVGSDFAHRAAYLSGVTHVSREARETSPGAPPPQGELPAALNDAVAAFRRAAEMPAKTPEQKHVVDLCWMAIGRLLYEYGAYVDASEAYSKVPRTSPEFTTALYELGWTYVRLKDYHRGQRALELLSVLEPARNDAADGALLRADLLLRAGRFDEALAAYHQAREEYDPLQNQVAAFLRNHSEPGDYYDVLTADAIAATGELPDAVLDWARDEAAESRMFELTDDVARSRHLVKRSRRLISQLEAALGSPSRAKMFPKLHAELEKALGLMNKLGLARRQLALGLDEEASSGASGELLRVREARRKLMARLGRIPAYPADFNRRQSETERNFNAISQELQRLTLRTDYLQAMVNGLRRVLFEGRTHTVTQAAGARSRFEREMLDAERELGAHRQHVDRLRQHVELGRAQVGLGDERFVEDDAVRRRFRELLTRELALVASGQDARSAVEYAKMVQPLLARADAAESALERIRGQLETAAEKRGRDVAAQVRRERRLMDGYAARLDELDQNARLLLGEMAMRNLELVRNRLRDVVRRADVGIVQHAWELRERHVQRVRQLQRERAREERYLDDELREVLDDAGGAE